MAGHRAYSGDATAAIEALRAALARYQASGSPNALDQAFAAAAAAIAALRGERAGERADADELASLMARLPEFERLVSAAVGEVGRSAHTGACELWHWFGLRSVPPEWDDVDRVGARALVAFACARASVHDPDPARLRMRLMRLAAQRWAEVLTNELRHADEELWRRALGDRYQPVRRCYAPRTRWRIRELSTLLISDDATVRTLRTRLARWLADGRDLDVLPAELEAAFVQARTPSHLA